MFRQTFTRFFFAAVLFFVATFFSFGNKSTDSLTALLKTTVEDTSKVRILAALSQELASLKPDDALHLAHQTIELSRKLNFKEGEALGFSRLALAYKQITKYDSAFYYFFHSNSIYAGLHHAEGQASTLMNIGTLFDRTGMPDSAAYYLFNALKMSESITNIDLKASVLTNIGLVLRNQSKEDEAINFFLQALDILKIGGNRKISAMVNENLGTSFLLKKDYATARNYLDKALEIYVALQDKRALGRININISLLQQRQGKFKEAIVAALTGVDNYRQIKNPNGEASAYSSLADIYLETKNYKNAAEYAIKSLTIASVTGNRANELEDYILLHKIYSAQGDYKKAYEFQSKASALKDSLFNEKKESIVSELQTKYETEKKESEIKFLNKDKELSAAKIHRQEILRNSIIAGTILLLIIGTLLFNRYRISQRHKQQAERMRISSDLHDEIGSTLSSIGMYSAYAKDKPESAGKALEEISSSSHDMIDDMNDIIWSINPRNDSFEHIIDRLRNYASRMTQSKNIVLDFRNDDSLHDVVLSMEKRKNLYLICKEAVNNAVKYSGCKNLSVMFYREKNILNVAINDNGCGFDTRNNSVGNGLKNISQRAKQINSIFSIHSSLSEGTRINLEMKLS
jgi:signal transduction histidine kinase